MEIGLEYLFMQEKPESLILTSEELLECFMIILNDSI